MSKEKTQELIESLTPNIIEIPVPEEVSHFEQEDGPEGFLEEHTERVFLQWEPLKKGEKLEGTLVKKNLMSFGNYAYVIRTKQPKGFLDILLKRGGQILDDLLSNSGTGDYVKIWFLGLGPQKKVDYNQPRLWFARVFKKV